MLKSSILLCFCCIIGVCAPAHLAAQSRITQAATVGEPFAALEAFHDALATFTGSAAELKAIATMVVRKDTAHQALQSIALSSKTEAIAIALATTKRGELLASQIVAADAILRQRFAVGLSQIPPEPSEDGLAVAAPTRHRLSLSEPDRAALVPLLAQLISSSDAGTRGVALIAAANYAWNDDPIRDAVLANTDASGPAPGAKLLYLARIGEGGDEDAIELAFASKRGQPAVIKRPTTELIYGYLVTPAAALACEALGELAYEEHLPYLHKALDHRDLRVQIEAARAMERIGSSKSAEVLAKKIERCEWPVYLACCRALAHCRSKAVMLDLIDGLKRADSRFRQHLLYAISAAGNQYGKQSYKEWYAWWKTLPADWDIDQAASKTYLERYGVHKVSMKSPADFYGLPVISSRLVFVVDKSGSMNGDPISMLIDNTTETLKALAPGARVNIVAYDDEIEVFSQRGVVDDRIGALNYVNALSAGGSTNIYDATLTALRDPSIDSLYLLTDGSPNSGQFSNWTEIGASIALLNRYRPIAIHTISFKAGSFTAESMKQVSDMNEGSHVAFD